MYCGALGEDLENLSHEPLHHLHPSETGLQQELKLVLHTNFQMPFSNYCSPFLRSGHTPSKPHARQHGPAQALNLPHIVVHFVSLGSCLPSL